MIRDSWRQVVADTIGLLALVVAFCAFTVLGAAIIR